MSILHLSSSVCNCKSIFFVWKGPVFFLTTECFVVNTFMWAKKNLVFQMFPTNSFTSFYVYIDIVFLGIPFAVSSSRWLILKLLTKFQRIRVLTQYLFSRQILKVCNQNCVQSKNEYQPGSNWFEYHHSYANICACIYKSTKTETRIVKAEF